MIDLLTIGDIKLDTFISIPTASVECTLEQQGCKLCLDYGKKIEVTSTLSQIAGSAPNVAVGLAKMTKKTAILAIMGRDITHTVALKFLKEHKVDTSLVTTNPGKQSSFSAVLNFQGENTQLVVHQPVDIKLPTKLPKTRWIHIGELGRGYDKLYRDLITASKAHNIRISFNPGQLQIDEHKKCFFDLINASEVLFVNLSEARQIVNLPTADAKTVIAKLYTLGADDIVITDGQNGAYAHDGKTLVHAPVFKVKTVETTGAGDAFVSGYLGALLHSKTVHEALAWGAINAASCVGQIGPTAGLLTHLEITRKLALKPSYRVRSIII
jgi:fructokinase